MIALALITFSYKLGHILGGYGVSWFIWGCGIFVVSSATVSWVVKKYKGVSIVDRLQSAVTIVTLVLFVLFAMTEPESFNNTVRVGIMFVAAPFAIVAVFKLLPMLSSRGPGFITDAERNDQQRRDNKEMLDSLANIFRR